MTKLDADLISPLPAFDPGSAAVFSTKRINPRLHSCLCLTWSGYPSNDDDDDDEIVKLGQNILRHSVGEKRKKIHVSSNKDESDVIS